MGGLWIAVDSGHCGIIIQNGNILDNITLTPEIYYRGWTSYFGEYVYPHKYLVDYDAYPYVGDTDEMIWAQSLDGTEWGFKLLVANQVKMEHAISVLKANGLNYDQKISKQIKSAVKEAIGILTNLQIRKTNATDLNELFQIKIQNEINKYVPNGDKINIVQVTIEQKKCMNKELTRVWTETTQEESKQKLVIEERKTRLQGETTKKALLEAKIMQDEKQYLAQIKREQEQYIAKHTKEKKDALSKLEVQKIMNNKTISEARTEAYALQIKADTEHKIEEQQSTLITKFPKATMHKEKIIESKSRNNNAKEHTYIIGDETVTNFAKRFLRL